MQEATSLDGPRIRTILEATGVFSPLEVRCALSLFDTYLEIGPRPEEYIFCCAYDENQTALGFVCYGKTSLTDRVYDLYWLAIDPDFQGRGIGGLLMRCLDDHLKALGARMVLAETSSRLDYAKTWSFYRRHGFEKVSTIKDYYALGEDLIVFAKRYH